MTDVDHPARSEHDRRSGSDGDGIDEVIELLDRGFCLLDLIADADGRTCDAVYRRTNAAFLRQTGLRDPVGRTLRELAPSIDPCWLDMLGQVVECDERASFVERAERLDRWFEIDAHRVGGPPSRRVAILLSDVTERVRTEAALRESEARFRQFANASGDLLWVRHAGSLRFEYLSPSCGAMLDLDCARLVDAADGHERWARIVHADDRDALIAHLGNLAAGQRREIEFRIVRPGDGEPRWLRDSGFPLRDDMGRVARIAGITADVTVEKETRERLKILVSELQHRTRNLLAVVQALAERTVQSSGGLDDFRGRYYPRLSALARVNELLSRLETDERVTFDQLVRAELAAHGALQGDLHQKVSLDGPSGIRLRSSTIQTLALALHELCTNSLKYGALSQPDGRLALSWSIERRSGDERRLAVEWTETGIAPVAPVGASAGQRRGFGRELIERALPRQLKTNVAYRLDERGVRCRISLPLSGLVAP